MWKGNAKLSAPDELNDLWFFHLQVLSTEDGKVLIELKDGSQIECQPENLILYISIDEEGPSGTSVPKNSLADLISQTHKDMQYLLVRFRDVLLNF